MTLLRHIVLMLLVVVCGLKYGQINERQEMFDKCLVNTEKWGPAQRQKRFSEQEVDSVKVSTCQVLGLSVCLKN